MGLNFSDNERGSVGKRAKELSVKLRFASLVFEAVADLSACKFEFLRQ